MSLRITLALLPIGIKVMKKTYLVIDLNREQLQIFNKLSEDEKQDFVRMFSEKADEL